MCCAISSSNAIGMVRSRRPCNARSVTFSAAATRRPAASTPSRSWWCPTVASTATSPCRSNMRVSCCATTTTRTCRPSSTRSTTRNTTSCRPMPCASMHSGVVSGLWNSHATMWCSTACAAVAPISAPTWRSPRSKAVGGARASSRCISMATANIRPGAALVRKTISAAHGASPTSMTTGI